MKWAEREKAIFPLNHKQFKTSQLYVIVTVIVLWGEWMSVDECGLRGEWLVCLVTVMSYTAYDCAMLTQCLLPRIVLLCFVNCLWRKWPYWVLCVGLLASSLFIFRDRACNDEKLRMRCPRGTAISVRWAQYGRPSPSECPPVKRLRKEQQTRAATTTTMKMHFDHRPSNESTSSLDCVAPSSLQVIIRKTTGVLFLTSVQSNNRIKVSKANRVNRCGEIKTRVIMDEVC